jgi:hypothetical protein
MSVGIIYYTDNQLAEPILSVVQNLISVSGLPVTSCSLEPMAFGRNVVVEGVRGYKTMFRQILTTLENAREDYVFFCEHDCLYPESHFDFTPPRDDTFYYNANVWRWWFGHETAIRHDGLYSVSSMCTNRELAIRNYEAKLRHIESADPELLKGREPRLGRSAGYEPGGRRWRRSTDCPEGLDTWRSWYPVVDIRKKGNFTLAKVRKDQFNRPPTGWEERPIEDIPGWNLKRMFNG